MPRHRDTDALHVGEGASKHATPLNRPIYGSTTFVFDSAAEVDAYQRGETDRYLYSRYSNPTVESAEAKIARLEGAPAAMVTASGMSAVATAVFGLLRPGDELVCSGGVYGGTLQLVTKWLTTFGVRVRVEPIDALAQPDRVLTAGTKMLWFETPVNPTLRCVSIARVAGACRAGGVLSVMDNTFATPVNQQPLALGVDLVMHAATKYLNGHSDVTAGAIAGPAALIDRLHDARKLFGGVLDPAAAYLLARGIKTLAVRMPLHNSNAQRLAEWLSADRRVRRVFYPGLPSHPDHAIAREQMSGFGGMICFELGDFDAACRLFDRLTLVKRATSLGGVESLCTLPVQTSHYGFTDEQLRQSGVTRGMVRLSVGLEQIDDLIADLDQALS